MKKCHIPLITLLFFTIVFFACGKSSKINYVTIGTGGVTGIYYPTGGAIARILNKKRDEYKIRASVESTGGSVYNINAVLSGDLEFGIAQSDRQYQAYYGKAEWAKKGPQKKLRSVFSIHPESVTLIASMKSGIKGIKDLPGKRINLGNPGSGHLQNARDILKAFGIKESSIKAEFIKAVESAGLLQDERIDGYFYTVGHPNGSIKEATSGRIKVRLIDIAGKEIDDMLKKYSYYARSIIPSSMYPNSANKKDVVTLGVKATLVTSSEVSDNIVYAITKEVFNNFKEFKKLHPAYQVLTRKNMLSGLSAPIHKGALKYYREAGLIKYIDKRLLK